MVSGQESFLNNTEKDYLPFHVLPISGDSILVFSFVSFFFDQPRNHNFREIN